MSLDYEIYYVGEKEELEQIISNFLDGDEKHRLFGPAVVSKTTMLTQDILSEMGHSNAYQSSAFLRLNKEYVSEATSALKALRDTVLPRGKALFILNGETELSA